MPVEFIFRPGRKGGRTVGTVRQEAGDDPFTAYKAAEAWCAAQGLSVGPMCGRSSPIGLMRGEYAIAKWRNLSVQERKALDGRLSGDFRTGPITLDVGAARPVPAQPERAAPSSPRTPDSHT